MKGRKEEFRIQESGVQWWGTKELFGQDVRDTQDSSMHFHGGPWEREHMQKHVIASRRVTQNRLLSILLFGLHSFIIESPP